MKVIVFGASGIIGSHMRLQTPDGVEPIWMRREADALHRGFDLSGLWAVNLVKFLGEEKPDVIVNLAGESRTDVVEKDPDAYRAINVDLPSLLSIWCDRHHAHYVHVSTQAVFDGEHAPYHPGSSRRAVNAYGEQKIAAEQAVERSGSRWSIVRPTFVLGVRPVPTGRENPIEQMLTAPIQKQVSDRWFSVSFARDVAAAIWAIALAEPQLKPIHLGIAHGVSRYDLARVCEPSIDLDEVQKSGRLPAEMKSRVVAVAHDEAFPGIAQRPRDTTFADNEGLASWEPRVDASVDVTAPGAAKQLQMAWNRSQIIKDGIARCRRELQERDSLSVEQRARELSLFTGLREDVCLAKIQAGFHQLHAEVAADFRASNPKTDDELLDWYRKTNVYIYELSAYHCDVGVPMPGWNYRGKCEGIAERLKSVGVKKVLVLGDAIAGMTIHFAKAGLDAVYNDLYGSETARFGAMRYQMYLGREMPVDMCADWTPTFKGPYDAIVACDVLEHVNDVALWVRAIHAALKPGGLFFAQNAFNCGSGPDGSIPMHLKQNDRWEHDWDPFLIEVGFLQQSSNWYMRSESAALDKIDEILQEAKSDA